MAGVLPLNHERRVRMKQATYHMRLDVRRSGTQAAIRIRQGEKVSRRIVFALADGSKPLEYTRDDAVIIRATKPDGTQILDYCEVSGTVISYLLGDQISAAEGLVECDLQINGGDGSVMFSPRFDILVEGEQFDHERIESVDEFNALTEALSRVQVVWSQEEERVEAEQERQDAEALREEAEQAREAKLANADARLEVLPHGEDAYVNAEMTVENGLQLEFGIPEPEPVPGPPGQKGDKGDPFTYEDFTEEQLASLTGPKGDPGDPFTYEDFTPEQLAALKGAKGDKGDKPVKGEDYFTEAEKADLVQDVLDALPVAEGEAY